MAASPAFALPSINALFNVADQERNPGASNDGAPFPSAPPNMSTQHRTSNSSISSITSFTSSSDDHPLTLLSLASSGPSSGRTSRFNSLNSHQSFGSSTRSSFSSVRTPPPPVMEARRLSVKDEEATETEAEGAGRIGGAFGQGLQYHFRRESDEPGFVWSRRGSEIDPLADAESYHPSHARLGSNASSSGLAYGADLPTLPSIRTLSLSSSTHPNSPVASMNTSRPSSSSSAGVGFFPSFSSTPLLPPISSIVNGIPSLSRNQSTGSQGSSFSRPPSPTRPYSAPWTGAVRGGAMGWGADIVGEMANASVVAGVPRPWENEQQSSVRRGSDEGPAATRRGSGTKRSSFGTDNSTTSFHPYASSQRPSTVGNPTFSSPPAESSRFEIPRPSTTHTTQSQSRRLSLPASHHSKHRRSNPNPQLPPPSQTQPIYHQHPPFPSSSTYPARYQQQASALPSQNSVQGLAPPEFASRVIFPTPTDEVPFNYQSHSAVVDPPQPTSYFDPSFSTVAYATSNDASRPSSSHSAISNSSSLGRPSSSASAQSRPLVKKALAADRPARKNTSTAASSQTKGGNSYTCQYCQKKFNRPSSLRIHTYSHTGEKPFACEYPKCGRKFSVSSNLKRHSRIHGSMPDGRATHQFETACKSVSASGADASSSAGPSRRGSKGSDYDELEEDDGEDEGDEGGEGGEMGEMDED